MHDVFISYKSQDSSAAAQLRNALEDNGIPCWMAERDIGPGRNYAADIPKAIRECKVFLLVLTENAQTSPWIPKEVDLAISARKEIIPIMLGCFEINPTFTFLLTGIQCHTASGSPTETVQRLLPKIRRSIAKAKNLPSTGHYLFVFRNACRRIFSSIIAWGMLVLMLYVMLRFLGIDALLWLPPQIRQAILQVTDTHLLPLWEKLVAWFRTAAV